MPITLLGVGQTVEDITCRSMTNSEASSRCDRGSVPVSCRIVMSDCWASEFNVRGLSLRWAVDPHCYMYYVRIRDSGAMCSSPTRVT